MSPSASPLFDASRMAAALQSGYGLQLSYLQSCDSTNRQCLQQQVDGLVIISEQQTAGRGRRGRQWHSPAGKNLYCSIGLSKLLHADSAGLISLQVGVAITELLHQSGYREVELKWPNDILMQGKKLGGILIETRPLASNQFYLVIGIGLNLLLDEEEMAQIDQPAIALNHNDDVVCDQQLLVTRLIGGVYRAVADFQVEQRHQLLQQFAAFDHLSGKTVRVKTVSEEFHGEYAGVQDDGQVCVELEQGRVSFAAADISLRERYAVD